MSLKSFLRAARLKLTPPGNRASLESSYRQRGIDGNHAPSEAGAAMKIQSGGH